MTSSHLRGELDPGKLEVDLPRLADFMTDAWDLGEIDVVHVNYEVYFKGVLESLPPALNPSIPPHISWLVYQVPDSPFGPFNLVQSRIGCRLGLKPRGLLTAAVCDNEAAARALGSRWGFRVVLGDVRVRSRADELALSVSVGHAEILSLRIVDPDLLPGSGIPISPGLNLAETPHGVQLVQVDPEYVITAARRGKPVVSEFDVEAWGSTLTPSWPMSGTAFRAQVTLPALRFIIDPSLPAEAGTVKLQERLSPNSA